VQTTLLVKLTDPDPMMSDQATVPVGAYPLTIAVHLTVCLCALATPRLQEMTTLEVACATGRLYVPLAAP